MYQELICEFYYYLMCWMCVIYWFITYSFMNYVYLQSIIVNYSFYSHIMIVLLNQYQWSGQFHLFAEFKKIYKRLDIEDLVDRGESFYNDMMSKTVQSLTAKGKL